MLEDIKTSLEEILVPYCRDRDIELVEIQIHRQHRTVAVKILADTKDKITIDECASINRFLTLQMEETGIVTGDYTIEVSSPGLDRPLKTKEDFARIIGQQVHFYFKEKIIEKLELTGIVKEIDSEKVNIQVNDDIVMIPLELINKALRVI